MSKRIGIITLYHKSNNYGGMLQAYALTLFINESIFLDSKAEQLTYEIPYERRNIPELIEARELLSTVTNKIDFIVKAKTSRFMIRKDYSDKCAIRYRKNNEFRDFTPHSNEIPKGEIATIEQQYDMFITGSDQIWNPNWFMSACFLDFVPKEKKKIAYAASMGVSSLTKCKVEKIIPLVERMDYVSVREKKAKEILQKFLPMKEIEIVVDPVFLLSRNRWDSLCNSAICGEKYIYTYFLGVNKDKIAAAENIGKILEMPIANVPYIHGTYNKYDTTFGDIKKCDAGPKDFIGLIRDAELIITDSFHAVAFSIIFNKNFVVFKRDNDAKKSSMNSRITDLLNELNLSERIIEESKQPTKEFLEKEIDYTFANSALQKNIEQSIDFLHRAIAGNTIAENKSVNE